MRYGFALVPKHLVYDWQTQGSVYDRKKTLLPPGAKDFLKPENPRLLNLQEEYQNCDYPSDDILVWDSERVKIDDMLYFRGHNAYVFQEGGSNRNIFGYLLAYYYTKSNQELNLFESLTEDDAFGAMTYDFDGKIISRDLLDSILEISFLERHLNISNKKGINVLDIGAGYGRLAHRMTESLSNLEGYYCTDAIPVSTFLAEYYLEYRKVDHKARILPLNLVDSKLNDINIDLAVNIHSFSECTLTVIEWWLDLLEKNEIPYLMVVPNSSEGMFTNDKKDFLPLIHKAGYQLLTREPKYQDPIVQKYAMNPDLYYLFEYR
jgi:hypothetical protein